MKLECFVHSDHRVRPIVVDEARDIVPAILKAATERKSANGEDQAVIDRL